MIVGYVFPSNCLSLDLYSQMNVDVAQMTATKVIHFNKREDILHTEQLR